MTTTPSRRHLTSQALYRHRTRPRWGFAILAWDHGEKRAYQFEDGNQRVFKRGYYTLLEEVDLPADRTRQVLDFLNRALGRSEALKRADQKHEALIPFAEQVAYFKEKYADGFAGQAWVKTMRDGGASRMLKRHRDPAVKRAKEQLAPELLDRLIESQQHDEVISGLIGVLEQTNLVTATKLRPLRSAPPHRRRAIAVALQDLLHGEGPLAPRFESYVSALDEPSWELATAPLALTHPEGHLCVSPGVFKHQALWLSPRLEHTRVPNPGTYQRYLRMAEAIQRQLVSEGLSPRDLLDIHDFVSVTLRPAARELLAARARESAGNAAAPQQQASGATRDPEMDAA